MPAPPILQLSMPAPDIALLTFDDPHKGANVLSSGVLAELEANLDRLEKEPGLAGLVIRSGKPGSFIVGADLREFVVSFNFTKDQTVAMCHRARRLFQRLSAARFVTVAAIDGLCLGGGAELACWCDRRLMSTDRKAQLGFPEIKLGLYPGWGGTARSAADRGFGERHRNGHERRVGRRPLGCPHGSGHRHSRRRQAARGCRCD